MYKPVDSANKSSDFRRIQQLARSVIQFDTKTTGSFSQAERALCLDSHRGLVTAQQRPFEIVLMLLAASV